MKQNILNEVSEIRQMMGLINEQMEAKKKIDDQLIHAKDELDEQVKLSYLSIPEIESLAKEIVGKLNDNYKEQLRRLDMRNEKQKMMLMNKILELVGINTDKMGGGPQG